MNDALESRLRSYGQVLDEAAEDSEANRPAAPNPDRRPRRRVLVAMGTAAAVILAGLGVVRFVGGDKHGYRVQVYGAGGTDLKRGPDGSFPHVLIEGWQVSEADDHARPIDASRMFHTADTTFVRRAAQVTLHMTEGDTTVRDGYLADRAANSDGQPQERTVLGKYPATVTNYKGSTQTSAIWFTDNVVYELMLETGSRDDFFAALDALRVVDKGAWEAALPDSTVTPAERGAVVDQMLSDVPLPPGFDVAPLRRDDAAVDHTQLGIKVAGSVACAWIDRWLQARKDGDEATKLEAVQAMGTSRNWKVLKDMQALKDMIHHSDYPLGVWQFADAMATGTGFPAPRMSVEQSAHTQVCPS